MCSVPSGGNEAKAAGPSAGGERGGFRRSNTRLANRQSDGRRLECGGEDTVEASLGVHWREGYAELIAALKGAKERAQAHNVPVAGVEIGGRHCAVYRRGRGTGGGKGQHYAFRVETGGLVLLIAEESTPRESTPNVRVLLGAVTLMRLRGLLNAWPYVRNVLESLGGFILWDKLSRVDLCVDIADVNVQEIVELIRKGCAIGHARARIYHELNGNWTGISIGQGGDVMIRIYDKPHEVYVVNRDTEKAALLELLRWGRRPEYAVRVEIQLRRTALRELGIGTVSEYRQNRAQAIRYVVEDWFRLTGAVPDRENNNTQRAATHELWLTVARRFATVCGEKPGKARRILTVAPPNSERLAKQSLGCGLRAYADLAGGATDVPFDEIILGVAQTLLNVAEGLSPAEVQRRYEAQAALVRARVVSWQKNKPSK